MSDSSSILHSKKSKNQSVETIDLRKALVVIRKHKWLIICAVTFAMILTAIVVSLVSPVFRSTATIIFTGDQSETGFEVKTVDMHGGIKGSVVDTQKNILKSRALARRVVRELQLTSHWEYNSALPVPEHSRTLIQRLTNSDGSIFSKFINAQDESTTVSWSPVESNESVSDGLNDDSETERAISKLMEQTQVISIVNTNLVSVSAESHDRELAPRIANEFAVALTEFYLDMTSSRDNEAKQFLEKKVADLKLRLDISEQQLLHERRRVGLSVDGGDISGQTMALLNDRLIDAKTKFELAKIQREQVFSVRPAGSGRKVEFSETKSVPVDRPNASGGGLKYVGTPYEFLSIIDSNDIVQQHKRLVQEALRTVEELDNRYGVKHPRVVDAKSNHSTLSRNLDRQIANVISSIEDQYLVARRLLISIRNEIRREEAKQFDRNSGRVSIKEIELSRNSNKRFYEEAVQELRSYQERDLQAVPISISDHAVVPNKPTRPNKTLALLLSIVASTFGAILLVLITEALRARVQGVGDIEKKLGIPVFGIAPLINSKLISRTTKPLVPGGFEDNRGAFEEAIWTICTSAAAGESDSVNQVIVVTSSLPGEGKSTLSTNLAYAFSDVENVLLIDGDMRRRGISNALGFKSIGLREVLNGELCLDDALRQDIINGLDILPAGRLSQSSGKLLATPEFEKLLNICKEKYDRIIVDLAPVQAVSDGMVVGRHADSTIYVVKADSTPLPIVKRGVSRLKEAGVEVSGVVISQVDFAKVTSYGGDYYYHGYYNHYGYGEIENKPLVSR